MIIVPNGKAVRHPSDLIPTWKCFSPLQMGKQANIRHYIFFVCSPIVCEFEMHLCLYFILFRFLKFLCLAVLLVRWRSRHVVPATSEQSTKQEASATRHVGERSASWVWRPRWTLRRLLKSLFWQTKHSRTLTDSFQMIQCCLET